MNLYARTDKLLLYRKWYLQIEREREKQTTRNDFI